mmetsp:Transcript_22079/g.56318  ORF Transcript_22079/g.56318 Transcript_22079/m.56318 type:complete len:612 (+) Transcript_22079:1036-2871(+)
MRSKIILARAIASMITAKPSQVSTMSAAARAASELPFTAMPTSPAFRAGASLTPSPVIPTRWPRFCSVCTILNLCSGKTSAKPLHDSTSSATCSACGEFSAAPSGTIKASALWMFVPMPRLLAVSFAIAVWSPVIIFTSMPSCRAFSIVLRVSWRGGSKSGTRPRNSQEGCPPAFGAALLLLAPAGSARATPMARKPREAKLDTDSDTTSWIRSASCDSARTTCGAPLTTITGLPRQCGGMGAGSPLVLAGSSAGPSTMASVRFVTGSKGTKWSVVKASRACACPRCWTSAQMQWSMASCSAPPRRAASAAKNRSSSAVQRCSSTKTGGRTESWFMVSVPVLSEQSTFMAASSSIAVSLQTSALLIASLCAPTAIVEVQTTCIAIGMEATSKTTAIEITLRTLSLFISSLTERIETRKRDRKRSASVRVVTSLWKWPPLPFACSADATSCEARPKKVRAPVSTTMPSISPRLTIVPWNTRPPACTVFGSDSPFREDWSTWIGSPLTSGRRSQSAGTTQPMPKCTTSPRTRHRAGSSTQAPSRFTNAFSASSFWRAAMALPALRSSYQPTRPFTICKRRRTPKSSQCCSSVKASANSTRIAIQIMIGIGPQK